MGIIKVLGSFYLGGFKKILKLSRKVNEKVIPVPRWVAPFLDYFEKSRKYDYLLKEILKAAQNLEKK